MMDAAIERLAREQDGSFELARRHAADAHLARRDFEHTPPREPTRLRWKGLDVSEEFRQYAERVARGEQLPPFEGRVLAEPNAAFPWGDGAQPEELPKKRSSHPMMWGAAIVVLGLLGWSVVLKLQTDERNAALDTSIAPLSSLPSPPAPSELEPAATPHDVVETPTASTEVLAVDPASASATPDVATGEPTPAVASPAPTPEPPADVAPVAATASPTTSAPASSAAAAAGVAVNLARPGALQQAVGAALAARSAPAASAAPATNAAPKALADDDFGIMTPSAPVASPAPSAPSPAPAGAKSSGSVGDLSRAGQPSAPGVRKEPGSESSAKGSLLVESPSF
ncbi:MAG TPA: hypothetical protein VMG12_30375 [Polyangiaceae bacterium]|nr:hypothetical protein [Polyangiaceae bacterium]